jgi:hypothetical protein
VGIIFGTLYNGIGLAVLTFALLKVWQLMRYCWQKVIDQDVLPNYRSLFVLSVFLLVNAILACGWTMAGLIAEILSCNHLTAASQFVLQMTPNWLIQVWLWAAWWGVLVCTINLFRTMRKTKHIYIEGMQEREPTGKLFGLPMGAIFSPRIRKTTSETMALPGNPAVQSGERGSLKAANEGAE